MPNSIVPLGSPVPLPSPADENGWHGNPAWNNVHGGQDEAGQRKTSSFKRGTSKFFSNVASLWFLVLLFGAKGLPLFEVGAL